MATGSWSGARHWGVQPDMMCTAKAITNGYFPFGAVMISEALAEVFENDAAGKAAIGHGYTYSGHPVGAAAALACIAETRRLEVPEGAAARGAELFGGLQILSGKYGAIGYFRGGHGLMCALELVSDPDSKSPIDKAKTAVLQQATYQAGAMIRLSGPNIILSPPLVIESSDIQTILSPLAAGFAAL